MMARIIGSVWLMLMVCATIAEASSIRLRPGSDTMLTHAPGYLPPEVPVDIAAAVPDLQRQIELSQPTDQLPYCADCQTLVQVAEWLVESNSSMTLVEALAEDACNMILKNSSALCPGIAKLLVDLAEKVPGLMKHIGLYEPIRVCSLISLCSVDCCPDDTTPVQIALGCGSNDGERHISWVTGGNNTESTVFYGIDGAQMNNKATGYSFTYTVGGWVGTIHRVVLSGLQAQTEYSYVVGGASGYSKVMTFWTWNDTALTLPFTLAVVGDMAAAESPWAPINIAWLNNASQAGDIQGVIHVGDISYADGYMATWDLFFNELQPTLTAVPYQVIPGNHELLFNFTAYDSRWFTSGLGATPPSLDSPPSDSDSTLSGTNLYSSWDAGCVHFIGMDSENVIDTALIDDAQLAWLVNDLNDFSARRASGLRSAHQSGLDSPSSCSLSSPTFLIVYLHRLLYCTDSDADNCGVEALYLRSRVESLFQKHQVDLVISGHMHNYERTVQVFNGEPDSSGPMYVVNGAGGNREGIEADFADPAPAWSAFRASVAGVGRIVVHNATTIEWNFLAQTGNQTAPNQIDQVFLQARTRSFRNDEEDVELIAEQ